MKCSAFSPFLLSVYLLSAGAAAWGQPFTPPSFYYKSPDTVVTYASNGYRSQSFLRELLVGSNYRVQWQQPVAVPVFRLAGSAFTVKALGGGMQTASLQLLDSGGSQWALRRLEKNVEKALPKKLQHTLAQQLSQDFISASLPYGSPVVGALAAAAGIQAPKPVVYFVAADGLPANYVPLFANRLCALEQRDAGFAESISTKELVLKARTNSAVRADARALLTARLLDMLVADWDRHEDNWRWGVPADSTHPYAPIPRDRDWAFYRSKGLLPFVFKHTAMPFLIGFKKGIHHIQALSLKAWSFDRAFLGSLNKADWEIALANFTAALTDSVIHTAVQRMPPEIYGQIGREFERRLRHRRDGLAKAAMNYYRFLSNDITINGSDEDERVVIAPTDGGIRLQLFSGALPQPVWQRLLADGETRTATIHLRGGKDEVWVDGAVRSGIHLTITFGTGQKAYHLDGRLKVKLKPADGGPAPGN